MQIVSRNFWTFFPETLIIQKMGSKKDDVVALYLENGLWYKFNLNKHSNHFCFDEWNKRVVREWGILFTVP